MLPNPRGPILHNNRSLLFASIIKKNLRQRRGMYDTTSWHEYHLSAPYTAWFNKKKSATFCYFLKNWGSEKSSRSATQKWHFHPSKSLPNVPLCLNGKVLKTFFPRKKSGLDKFRMENFCIELKIEKYCLFTSSNW